MDELWYNLHILKRTLLYNTVALAIKLFPTDIVRIWEQVDDVLDPMVDRSRT
jgi:hypothetical protein